MANAGAKLNIINMQVRAEDQMRLDIIDGTYADNVAGFDKYYFVFGDHQVEPMGYNANLVPSIKEAMPQVNTVRIGFNENAFDENGELDPQYQAFLNDCADNGIKVIFVYASYGSGFVGREGDMTYSEIEDELRTTHHDKLLDGWTKFGEWLGRHPEMSDDIAGLEVMNEPASYDRAADLASAAGGPGLSHYTSLYAEHVGEVADLINGFYDGDIYVSAWGWGGDVKSLAVEGDSGASALASIREAVGDDLVWSVHYYPGWGGTGAMSPDGLRGWFDQHLSPLGDDAIVLTETNSYGATTNDVGSSADAAFDFSRMVDYFAEQDIGVGWFPGVQTGGSGLLYVSGGASGSFELRHQDSFATALNAHTSDSDMEGDGSVRLVKAGLRNEGTASDYATHRYDDVQGMGLGFGGDGADTMQGMDGANNFLYGQDGDDLIVGGDRDDYLFGQGGNDTLIATGKITMMDGGRGDDLLVMGGDEVVATGGEGSDVFEVAAGTRVYVADFNSALDRLSVGDLFSDAAAFNDAATVEPNADDPNVTDLVISIPGGGKLVLLGGGKLVLLGGGKLGDNPAGIVAEWSPVDPKPEEPEPVDPKPEEPGLPSMPPTDPEDDPEDDDATDDDAGAVAGDDAGGGGGIEIGLIAALLGGLMLLGRMGGGMTP